MCSLSNCSNDRRHPLKHYFGLQQTQIPCFLTYIYVCFPSPEKEKKHFDDLFEKFCAQTSEKLFERFSREKMGSHWQSALEILCLAIKCTVFTSLCTCETFPSPTVLFVFAIDFQTKLEFYFQNWSPIKMSPTLLVITIFPTCFQGLRNVAFGWLAHAILSRLRQLEREQRKLHTTYKWSDHPYFRHKQFKASI